jgi:hypothetical protein
MNASLSDAIVESFQSLIHNVLLNANLIPVQFPARLYHYTDAVGAEGILVTRKMRATHAWFLNDPHEFVAGQLVFKDVCEHVAAEVQEMDAFLCQFANRLAQDTYFASSPGFLNNIYCASFSEKADDLSQYRAYSAGGNGYCLGFDGQLLAKQVANIKSADNPALDFQKVVYLTPKLISNLTVQLSLHAKQLVRLLRDNKVSLNEDEGVHKCIADALYSSAIYFAYLCKQEGFSDEAEWRLVPSLPQALKFRRHSVQFQGVRQRANYFAPYIEIPLQPDPSETFPVVEIFVGPKLQFTKAKFGIECLFEHILRMDSDMGIEIRKSSTALQ